MTSEQLLLIPEELGDVIDQIKLASKSKKSAYYHIYLIKLAGCGYLIQKKSGYCDKNPHLETYWRPNRITANKKIEQLLRAKTSPAKSRQRHYVVIDNQKEE